MRSWRTAYIIDLDGTLALHGSRGYYDWNRVGEDRPNTDVIRVVQAVSLVYATPVLTGRSEVCRDETITWLRRYVCEHALGYCFCPHSGSKLWMRKDDDRRKSYTVKAEMLNGSEKYPDAVTGHYDVIGAFDDRKQDVDMWRAAGLAVFDVAGAA